MATRRQASGEALKKARMAKKTKKHIYKAAAAKRTKVGQSLKKHGVPFTVGSTGVTVGRTITVNQPITRNIGHPARLPRRNRRGRFQRTHRPVTVISRRTQGPAYRISVRLPRLNPQVAAGGNVASSWISFLQWNPNNNTVTMGLLSGWNYVYRMTFRQYEGWYYAHSKGTYWHDELKGHYYSRYINKYWLP